MADERSLKSQTEAVGFFDSTANLQDAIDALRLAGFDRAELSLLATEATMEAKLGHLYDRVEDLEDDLAVPRRAYISKAAIGDAEGGLIAGLFYVGALASVGGVIASGGTLLAAVAAGAVAGSAGGLIGSGLAKLVGDRYARQYEDQLAHGGLLLWVRTRDDAHEQLAQDILRAHSGRDVHVHSIEPVMGE